MVQIFYMDPNVCHMFRSILATLGVCVSEAFGIFGQNLGSPNWILVKPECLFRFWQYLGVLPIRMHAKLCTYLIILYTLTFKHSTIECVMHRHELFKGKCCIAANVLKVIYKEHTWHQTTNKDGFFDLPPHTRRVGFYDSSIRGGQDFQTPIFFLTPLVKK